MYSLIYPLAGRLGDTGVSITREILDAAGGYLDIFASIGIGIASVFLLLVVFVYAANILDGGKFQVKMLLPLLIYLCVCNYKLVASPIVNFGLTIQRECVNACVNGRAKVFGAEGSTSVMGFFWSNLTLPKEVAPVVDPDNGDEDGANSNPNVEAPRKEDENGRGLLGVLKKGWTFVKTNIIGAFTNNSPLVVLSYGMGGVVGEVLDWIAQLLEVALTCLGGLMTGIVVVFGPITWAFAVFPGNQRTLSAWAIRICQFMLYSPLTAIISTFTLLTVKNLADWLASGDSSFGAVMGIAGFLLAEVSAFLSVPAIASMIIEGAQGAITISQGLMTASSMAQIGEVFRDRKMQNTMDNMGGPSSPSPSA